MADARRRCSRISATACVAEQVARGVNVQWWSEFTAQAGPLGRTFQPSIIGFAAVLDNLSAFADGEARPSPLAVARRLLPPAMAVPGRRHRSTVTRERGRRDRMSSSRPAASISCVSCGWRRSSRSPTTCSSPSCTRSCWTNAFARADARCHRRADGVLRAPGALCDLRRCCSCSSNIIFDYAKVRAVVEDRRSMIGAIVAGARFARRNAAAVAALYLLTGSLFVVLLVVYAVAAPGAGSTGAGIWLGLCHRPALSARTSLDQARVLRLRDRALSGPAGARRLHRELRAVAASRATDCRERFLTPCQPVDTLCELQFDGASAGIRMQPIGRIPRFQRPGRSNSPVERWY